MVKFDFRQFIVIVFFAAFSFIACEESRTIVPEPFKEDESEPSDSSSSDGSLDFNKIDLSPEALSAKGYKYLVGIADTLFYNSVDSLYSRAAGSISGNLEDVGLTQSEFNTLANIIYSSDILSLASKMFVNSGNGAKGRVEEYKFNYKTLSAEGDSIVVSGVAVLPNYQTNGRFSHTLDALTLSHDHLKDPDDYISKIAGLQYLRAFFNQLVVLSDYEGYGISRSEGPHPFICYNELARQSIDCAMAALELLDYIGVKMKSGYDTYNMGMSKGAGVALATQRLLENSEPLPVRSALRVKQTYVASGIYDFKGTMEYYNSKRLSGEATDDENLKVSWMTAVAIYFSYISHSDVFAGFELKDFFTDDFYDMAEKNKIFGSTEIVWWGTLRNIFKKNGYTTLDKVLNKRFFTTLVKSDYGFDENDALVKALFSVLTEENPTTGWVPKAPVLMEHSLDDELSEYDVAYQNFLDFKHSGQFVNMGISLNTYSELEHSMISGVGLVRMSILEEPASPILLNVL